MLCAEKLWIHPHATSIIFITEESQNLRCVDGISSFLHINAFCSGAV